MIGEFAAVFAALYGAHHVGDFWVQTDRQAVEKGLSAKQAVDRGLPEWWGRWMCAKHVATYHLTVLIAIALVAAATGWRPGLVPLLAGLAVSALTHYLADRRAPLKRLAELIGSGGFYALGAPRQGRDDNPSLGTGAYALDQSWHIGWLFVSALVIAL